MNRFNAECNYCIHCDAEKLMCYPNDPDCHKEYELDWGDLYSPKRCDFFEEKEAS